MTKPNRFKSPALLLLFLTITLLFSGTLQTDAQQTESIEPAHGVEFSEQYGFDPGHICELPFTPYPDDPEQLPPSMVSDPERIARQPQVSDIQVNYIGSWNASAMRAFEYAVSIWETQINSTVPIAVNATWAPLSAGVLGSAGPTTYYRDFPNAPQSGTFYPVALANSLAGFDLNSGSDINATFSSSYDWYLGTDGNPGTKVDFVTVVLHELGHGLGFASSFYVPPSTNLAYWGLGTNYSFKFDSLVENGGGNPLTTGYPNNSSALLAQLTSNSVYFDGFRVGRVNSNHPAALHAPSTWSQGSSISHLGQEFNYTTNSLMTYSVSAGVAEHFIGELTIALLNDLGWSTLFTPILEPASYVLISGGSADNAIDLWALATDDSHDSQLNFSISNSSGNNIDVTLDRNRYLDISTSGEGTLVVNVMVSDPDATPAESTVTIYAWDTIYPVYLPVILK